MTIPKRKFVAFLSYGFLTLGASVALSGCSTTPLPSGLTARMDHAGANLDRAEALLLISQFRASRGARPLVSDPDLNATAQNMANRYASSSARPPKPGANVIHMRLSAGYSSFAQTFSGWRGRTEDANIIADPNVTSAGLGVAYSANSSYGVHWVLLLGTSTSPAQS